MNRINASEREKVAAQFEGDAQRILIVERAKAEAESKRLQGQGIADQRREIARGLEDSVKVLNNVDINSVAVLFSRLSGPNLCSKKLY